MVDAQKIENPKSKIQNPKVAVRILNLNTGETYTGRLAITGNYQVYLPIEIQKMLEGAGRIRIQLL